MKKLIISALLFLSLFSITAESLSLESTCQKLSEHPHTKGLFTQNKTVVTKGKSRVLKSSGTFIFSIDGIMWKTEKPFPSSTIVSKTQLIQVAADGKETVVDMSSNDTFSNVANTLVAIFSNDLTLLKDGFNIDFKDNGNNKYSMKLTPKAGNVASVMESILIEGTVTSTATIDSITMTESSGSPIVYEFTEQTYPKELTADDKAFFRIR